MSKNKHRWKMKYNDDYDYNNFKVSAPLFIEAKAYEKMSHFVQLADGEISGFGKIKHIKDPNKNMWLDTEKYILEDVEIFNQKCSYGGTTLSGEMLSKFIIQIIRKRQNPNDWRLWWHSHNDFGVMWSGTDENAISTLIENSGKGSELISVCMNKHYDIIARRDTGKKTLRVWRTHENMKVKIIPRITTSVYTRCEAEIKEKVKKHTYRNTFKGKKWQWDGQYTNRDWWNKVDEKLKLGSRERIIDIPRLEDKRLVQPISSKDALMMGLYFNTRTGLFVRIGDKKAFTVDEVRRGFHKVLFPQTEIKTGDK